MLTQARSSPSSEGFSTAPAQDSAATHLLTAEMPHPGHAAADQQRQLGKRQPPTAPTQPTTIRVRR